MLNTTCPQCGATLTKLEETTPDTSGYKWYQFAGPRQFCPSCKTELKLSTVFKLWRIIFALLAIVIYFYGTWSERELVEKIIFIIVCVALIFSPGFIWPRKKYVKKDN